MCKKCFDILLRGDRVVIIGQSRGLIVTANTGFLLLTWALLMMKKRKR